MLSEQTRHSKQHTAAMEAEQQDDVTHALTTTYAHPHTSAHTQGHILTQALLLKLLLCKLVTEHIVEIQFKL